MIVPLTMAAIAGVIYLAGVYHLVLGASHLRTPRKHVTFGIMCLLVGTWAALGTQVHTATDPETFVAVTAWRLGFGHSAAIAMVWFFAAYGHERPKVALGLITAVHAVFLVANAVTPYTVYYAGLPTLRFASLPWGELVTMAPPTGWTRVATNLANLSVFVFGAWVAGRLWLRGSGSEAIALAVALVVMGLGLFDALGFLVGPFPSGEPAFVSLIVIMALSMATEVADASRVQEKLGETRERLSAMVDSAPEAILLLSGETGKAMVSNRQALELFQIERAGVEGFDPVLAAPPVQADGTESSSMFAGQLRTALAGSRSRFPWIVQRSDGAKVPCQALLVRLPGEDPTPVRLSLLDVSQLEAAEERSIKLEAQLRQAQKLEAVGRLTGGIAHDFNNLLTVIRGSLELLRDAPLEKDADRQLLDLAITAADRSTDLTQRLLAFSRRQPLSPRVVEPRETIGTVAELLRRTLGEDITLEIECDDGVAAVRVDPVQLESTLVNLAINAADAMPQGGSLAIGASNVELESEQHVLTETLPAGPYVQFHVTDTGHGIDEAIIERVLEPFYTTKEVGKGTGLGLSAAYGFATQSGGTLRIESEVGRGTTVWVFLPPAENGDQG